MVRREEELQRYLSSNEEKRRSSELNQQIEASLEKLLHEGEASPDKFSALDDSSAAQSKRDPV